jgi:hypothetical protein
MVRSRTFRINDLLLCSLNQLSPPGKNFHVTRRYIQFIQEPPPRALYRASLIQSNFISLRSILILPCCLLLRGSEFPTKNLCAFIMYVMRAKVTHITFGEEYDRPWSSSLCKLLHVPFTASVFGTSIPPCALFSNILNS